MVETNLSDGLSMGRNLDPAQDVVDLVEDARFEALRFLQPGLYALHRQLLSAMQEETVRSIVAGVRPLIIGIRSDVPCLDLQIAVRATIEWIAAEATGRTLPDVEIILESDDVPSERNCIKAALLVGRIVVLLRSGTAVSAHDALLDVRIEITEIGLSAISDSLAQEYGPDSLPHLDVRPAAFTYDLLDLACAKAGSASDAWAIVRSLGAGKPSRQVPSATEIPPLDSLAGYGEAMEWARDLRVDIADYRVGDVSWSDVSASALLVGPPGTGKTTFAAAVAADLNLTFHATSYAAWQRAGDGHLGDLMKEMSRVFDLAKATRPSLVFIDEIDSIPRRSATRRSADWWRTICNALLEFLDGSNSREGIVVIAACNDDTDIDEAILRSGRLDRRFAIGLPEPADFARILASHVGGGMSAAALLRVAAMGSGNLSGADAARIARDARRIARRARRSVTVADLEAAAFPAEHRSDDALWLIAVHEAGHALVALASGVVPVSATLLNTGRSGGSVRIDESGRDKTLACDLESDARIALGGRAAEVVILGAASTGSGGSVSSDLGLATRIVKAGLTLYGFGDSLEYSGRADPVDVADRLRRLFAEAVDIIGVHRSNVEALARELVERRTLSRDDLTSFARERGIGPASL